VSYNNKSIVPGILVKTKTGLENSKLEDHLYILTEIKKTKDGYYDQDTLVFYSLAEERFFPVYLWYFERYIDNGTADIMA